MLHISPQYSEEDLNQLEILQLALAVQGDSIRQLLLFLGSLQTRG